MKVNIIDPYFVLETEIDRDKILKQIEQVARTCYQSYDRIKPDSHIRLVNHLVSRGHLSMLEFLDITVRFIVDRGVSHELVRHRLASYAQESTRYVAYRDEITFIKPPGLNEGQSLLWYESCWWSACAYLNLLERGVRPEIARDVLPMSLKTEIVVKANLREWKHILDLRTDKRAHPQMRQVMVPLYEELHKKLPEVF